MQLWRNELHEPSKGETKKGDGSSNVRCLQGVSCGELRPWLTLWPNTTGTQLFSRPRGHEFLTCGIDTGDTDKLKTCRHGRNSTYRAEHYWDRNLLASQNDPVPIGLTLRRSPSRVTARRMAASAGHGPFSACTARPSADTFRAGLVVVRTAAARWGARVDVPREQASERYRFIFFHHLFLFRRGLS